MEQPGDAVNSLAWKRMAAALHWIETHGIEKAKNSKAARCRGEAERSISMHGDANAEWSFATNGKGKGQHSLAVVKYCTE